MRDRRVRALLMGGQACVFYGAAEFSRDTDFAILADAANLARLRRALADLQAVPIAVPELSLKRLRRGHAAGPRSLQRSRAPRISSNRRCWRRNWPNAGRIECTGSH
jgi:hypothetical protein